jgi:hypothetical protein
MGRSRGDGIPGEHRTLNIELPTLKFGKMPLSAADQDEHRTANVKIRGSEKNATGVDQLAFSARDSKSDLGFPTFNVECSMFDVRRSVRRARCE